MSTPNYYDVDTGHWHGQLNINLKLGTMNTDSDVL